MKIKNKDNWTTKRISELKSKKLINKNGYEICSRTGKLKHQLVYFKENKGTYKKGYSIHHVNGCKLMNTISNLIYIDQRLHTAIHEKFGFKAGNLPSKKMIKKISSDFTSNPDEYLKYFKDADIEDLRFKYLGESYMNRKLKQFCKKKRKYNSSKSNPKVILIKKAKV